jgi:hypothetical protein
MCTWDGNSSLYPISLKDFGKVINMVPVLVLKEVGVDFWGEICSSMLKLCTRKGTEEA